MSKHCQRKGSQFQPKMPKFLWLLRDMDLSTGSGSPTDWLLRKLQVPRCKDIFEALTSSFSSIECTFLPPPALEKEVLHNIIQRKDQLTPHFNEELMKTENKILSIVEPKCCECGPFTGFSLASLIEECVAQVNHQSDVPALDTTWKVATELQLQQFTTKLVDEYEEEMRSTLEDKLPIEEGLRDASDTLTLMGIHNQIVKQKILSLEKKLANLVPVREIQNIFLENSRQEFLNRIIEGDTKGQIIGGKLAPFLHENYKLSNELCTKTYDRFYDQLVASKVRCAFAEGIPHDITPDVAQFEEQYFKVACGPAKDDIFNKCRAKSMIEEHKLRQIPGHVRNIQVVGIGSDRIKLSWAQPLVNPEAARAYEVYTVNEDGTLTLTKSTGKLYTLLIDLKSNHQYTFVVRARNDHVLGSYISHISVKTSLNGVARSAVGVGTLLACTVGSPVAYPTMFTIGIISSIRNDISQGKRGLAAAKGVGLALMPLTIPIGVLGTIGIAPLIAFDLFLDNAAGDLS